MRAGFAPDSLDLFHHIQMSASSASSGVQPVRILILGAGAIGNFYVRPCVAAWPKCEH